MEFLTDKELRYLVRLVERAKKRMPFEETDVGGYEPLSLPAAVIDVESRPVPPNPAQRAAEPDIPAPGNGQPEPFEPDYEEFGGEDDDHE